MIAPNDIDKRREEIRDLVSDGNVGQALKKLMDFTRDFSDDIQNLNEAVVISANFRTLEAAERRRTIAFKEARDERSQLLFQALNLLEAIVDELTRKVA